MVNNIRECLITDILLTAIKRRKVRSSAYEWRSEDVTAGKEVVHPLTTFDFGHDPFGVRDAGGICNRGELFGLAYIFALTWIEGRH